MTSLTDPAALATFAVAGAVAESLRAARGTEVTFPLGATSGRCRVVATLASVGSDYAYVISDRTPFHPCDQGSPKQPGDRGHLEFGESKIPVLDSYLAEHDLSTDTVTILGFAGDPSTATEQMHQSGDCCGLVLPGQSTPIDPSLLNLRVDLDVPDPSIHEGSGSTRLHVAHVISLSDAAELRVGMEGVAHVDSTYRNALSTFHSAYHLTMLAFNRASKRFVTGSSGSEINRSSSNGKKNAASSSSSRSVQEMKRDALDEIDVSALLLQDVSLTPQGFRVLMAPGRADSGDIDVAGLHEELPAVMIETTSTLHQWVESDAMAEIDTAGPFVGSSRTWLCYLPEADVAIPCDGTHAEQLSDLNGVSVTFEQLPDNRWLICGHTSNLEA